MLDPRHAELMQRVLQGNKERVSVGPSAREIHELYALGVLRGKTLHLSTFDRSEMTTMLEANGFALLPVAASSMRRSEKLGAGVPFEKTGGNAVKVGRVSIKALAGQGLLLNNSVINLPAASHLDVAWNAIHTAIGHNAIMVVENYEVFDQIHRISFNLPERCASPLVVYLGDRLESRQDNVRSFLSTLNLPVLACVDLDPKGLMIAHSLPRLSGVVAPAIEVLENLLSSPKTGRWDLYANQLGEASALLDAVCESGVVRPLWDLLKKHRSAIVQERWLTRREQCQLWPPV